MIKATMNQDLQHPKKNIKVKTNHQKLVHIDPHKNPHQPNPKNLNNLSNHREVAKAA